MNINHLMKKSNILNGTHKHNMTKKTSKSKSNKGTDTDSDISNSESEIEVIDDQPKKRGRKPKLDKKKDNEVKVPKKRGRKPNKEKQSLVPVQASEFVEENENVVIHLPLQNEDIDEIIKKKASKKSTDKKSTDKKSSEKTSKKKASTKSTTSQKNSKVPLFEEQDEDALDHDEIIGNGKIMIKKCHVCKEKDKKIKELHKALKDITNSVQETQNSVDKERKVSKTKLNFVDVVKGQQQWKETTDIVCWWCTYPFETVPCSIPTKYYKETFYVFGCFCSFNCAASFNLDMNDYKVWERYTLINLLYRKIYNVDKEIQPAPARYVLKKFGGKLDIETFRKDSQIYEKEYRYIMPPMISIVPLIEEDYRDKHKGIKKANINALHVTENLKLKRSKPQANQMNLIKSMGLKIKSNTKTV